MAMSDAIRSARETLSANRVFGEPIEKDGLTVITVATVYGGAGGGGGNDAAGQTGEGGGFGLIARPTGAFVITDGTVRWHPVVDVNRLIVAGAAIVLFGLATAARSKRSQRRV